MNSLSTQQQPSPQPITYSAAVSAGQLPPGLTNEKVNGMFQRARMLQNAGGTEQNNQELASIMNTLRNISRLQKQRSPKTAQAMAHPNVPGNNSSQSMRYVNGKHPPAKAMLNGTAHQLATDKEGQADTKRHVEVPSLDSKVPSTFTAEQLSVLKSQMKTFQLMSRNLPMTPRLGWTSNPQNSGQPFPSPTSDGTLVNQERIPRILDIPPVISAKSIDFSDPGAVRDLLEAQVDVRIRSRIQELEQIAAHLGDGGRELDIVGQVQSAKVRALVELKSLRLLNRQRKLKQDLAKALTPITTLDTAVNRAQHRRMKKQSLREARMTEKVERAQRLERERKAREKHVDYLNTILNHGRELVQASRAHLAKQGRLGRAVLQYHQHIEKEEARRADRVAKERLKALRNDDEEAYMKLLDEAKDTRLTHLLRQTGAYLDSLAQAVAVQQSEVASHLEEVKTGEDDEDTVYQTNDGRKIDYYQIAHRITEEVEQASILVGGKLKDYQIKGLQWMVSLYNNRLNGILADEMGLGKTIQTISLITYLIEKKRQMGPFLIIVPLSTLTNWTLEFEKWAPSVTKVVYKGPPTQRKNIQYEMRHNNFQVLLTTYEYIIKDRPVLGKIKWLHIIIDEGHRMKNAQSKLSATLTQFYSSKYRIILTGTPLQNNLPELWALLNFVLPKIFNSVKSFEEWFNSPFSKEGGQDKIELNEEEQLLIIKRLHKVLRPFLLRRLKKDVESELPDKVEKVIKCKSSALQLKLYAQMKKSGTLYSGTNDQGKMSIKGLNNMVMQLRKICNHPFVFEEVEDLINPSGTTNELLYRAAGKVELLDRMLPKLKTTGHRVLIFFQMTAVMTIMEDFLQYRGYEYLRLDGSTKADDRTELLKQFNAQGSPYFVFLLSTRAGGLGLNLQSADTVILYDSDWNPHQDLQAQDRAHRIGQTNEVRIFRLITERSIEENILARAQWKLDIDGKVIQAGKFDNRSTDEDREALLRTLLEDKNDEANDVDDEEEVDDDELNMLLKRSDEEFVIFEKMDKQREREEEARWIASGKKGPRPSRLMDEHELPEIYTREDTEEVEDLEIDFGRGMRSRGDVRYDDHLTEDQWLNAIEDSDTDMKKVIERKERARRKREAKRLAKEAGEESSSVETPPPTRKRKSRKVKEVEDEMVDNTEEETPASSPAPKKARARNTKPKQQDVPETLSPETRKQFTHIFETVYDAIESKEVPDEDGDMRQQAALFLVLPNRREYPDYYELIRNPIAMDTINTRIHSPYYASIDQFRQDWYLMFKNARAYNEEGSWVFEDANALQELVDKKLSELAPNDTVDGGKSLENGDAVKIKFRMPPKESNPFSAEASLLNGRVDASGQSKEDWVAYYQEEDNEDRLLPILDSLISERAIQSDVTVKDLAVILGRIRQFQDSHATLEQPRIPTGLLEISGDEDAESATDLTNILLAVFEYRRATQWSPEDLERPEKLDRNIAFIRHVRQCIINNHSTVTKAIAFSPNIPADEVDGLKADIQTLGGETTSDVLDATHVLLGTDDAWSVDHSPDAGYGLFHVAFKWITDSAERKNWESFAPYEGVKGNSNKRFMEDAQETAEGSVAEDGSAAKKARLQEGASAEGDSTKAEVVDTPDLANFTGTQSNQSNSIDTTLPMEGVREGPANAKDSAEEARKYLAEQAHEVIIPSYAAWFDMSTINEIEQNALPEFFSNRNRSKTPSIYKDYRDFMINTYRLNPSEYLTVTACRRNLAGDVCAIIRVHAFLEQWGLINYQIDPETRPSIVGPAFTGHFRVTADTPRGLQPFKPNVPTTGPNHVNGVKSTPTPKADIKDDTEVKIETNLELRKNIFDTTEPNGIVTDEESATNKVNCFTCGVDCTKTRYHSTKTKNFDLCTNCYTEGRFPSTLFSADFVRVDSSKYKHAQNAKWTDQETLLLLEGIEMYEDDWNSIASHVGTRTREQCILHFLQLPIEDPYAAQQMSELGAFQYNRLPISQADNPVMSVVAFLASVVKPGLVEKIANKALQEAYEDENEAAQNEIKAEPMEAGEVSAENQAKAERDATMAKVGTVAFVSSAVKAKALANNEEREVIRLVNEVVTAQMDKVQLKLKQFTEMEEILDAERRELEKQRQQLFVEKLNMKRMITQIKKELDQAGGPQQAAESGFGSQQVQDIVDGFANPSTSQDAANSLRLDFGEVPGLQDINPELQGPLDGQASQFFSL
ncbi:hypothetical protein BZG36_01962 [Bifiguratus adelaidae]|uniref:Vacuolar import and degradation protein 21 n=1 Tax=Bifiguratus adelaidae TaxID=1938954 RepID=A0A261Y3R4_9FUNG|nr:hypothetical protein BZG36_01962 [Bifiguratus adelaidae]